MPKGIKKTTTATLRADINKQMAAIKAKEIALAKAKDDYDKKVRQLKAEIAEANAKLKALRKELEVLIHEEQKKMMSQMMFNGDLTTEEITKALNALHTLLYANGDRSEAIKQLQVIAETQENSAIDSLVDELEQQET